MKNRFQVVDVTEEPNLTLTRQQQDMRNRGFVLAVADGSDGSSANATCMETNAATGSQHLLIGAGVLDLPVSLLR